MLFFQLIGQEFQYFFQIATHLADSDHIHRKFVKNRMFREAVREAVPHFYFLSQFFKNSLEFLVFGLAGYHRESFGK